MKGGVDARRRHILREGRPGKGPVVYWMSRDQRVRDNWALLAAREDAAWRERGLAVVFCLAPEFLGATRRAYDFLLRGLREVEDGLRRLRIPFRLLEGDPATTLPTFLRGIDAAELVTDFDPLRPKRKWRDRVAECVSIPFIEVDAHNIVPCRQASDKREWAAATLRPKILRVLPMFLTEFPAVEPLRDDAPLPEPVDWDAVAARLPCDGAVGAVPDLIPGAGGADVALDGFLKRRMRGYAVARNDPNLDGQSRLSPWLHFGHLAPQRAALEASRATDVPDEDRAAFLEQIVVRRELADNFCLYEAGYDSFAAAPAWAVRTHEEHRSDAREHVYDFKTFDRAGTHDPLWNAAQMEMCISGSMHNYMRMYWCKKILEWSATPEDAWRTAIRLNDRYELDGRDPNGYAGVAWSIGGVHDRPWKTRPVFGSIRYMNDRGCRGKFDVDAYISTWLKTSPAKTRGKVRKDRR